MHLPFSLQLLSILLLAQPAASTLYAQGTPVRYEAENYSAQAGTNTSSGAGSTGSFQDFGGSGTYIEWNNIDGSTGMTAAIEIAYAVGTGDERKCDIIVNGATVLQEVPFTNTGSWTSWSTVLREVPLIAGQNTVRIEASAGSSGPNIDYIDVILGATVDLQPQIETTALPPAVIGFPYSQELTATGADSLLSWSLISGSLPDGLNFASDGTISGSPIVTATSTFTVQVADDDGDHDTQELSIEVLTELPPNPNPRLLVESTGQFRNIGDQAHKPGAWRVFSLHFPEGTVDLHGRDALTAKHHPESESWSGDLTDYDFFVGASAPKPVGTDIMDDWVVENPGKPFGAYGINVDHMIFPDAYDSMQYADFICPRNTRSIDYVIYGSGGDPDNPGTNAFQDLDPMPYISFGPDCSYGFDMSDDAWAEAFLASKNLTAGEFLVVIPILRRTPPGLWLEEGPYYEYTDNRQSTMEDNRQTMDHDFGILRDVIIRWVRETGLKVLLAPEMTYSIDCFDELIIDQLPTDVVPYVEKFTQADGAHTSPAGFWYADEAHAVFARARAMVSMDNHSPIKAVNAGVPLLFPSPRSGSKEIMWRDIGLDDWFWYGVDDLEDGTEVADKLMEIHNDYPAAKATVLMARERVRNIYLRTIGEIRTRSMNLPHVGDTDDDGIADVWEVYHYGSPAACDPAADSNGNGMTAMLEYGLGLTPWKLTQPEHSRFAGTQIEIEAGADPEPLSFVWRKNANAPQLGYQVEYATNLAAGSWTVLDPSEENVSQTLINPDLDGDQSTELWETTVDLGETPPETVFFRLKVNQRTTGGAHVEL